MRFGRSRTCSSRLNDLRARGETTVVVKKNSLPWACDYRQVIGSRAVQKAEQYESRAVQNGRAASGTRAGLSVAQPARVPEQPIPPQADASAGRRYAVGTVAPLAPLSKKS